LFAFKCSRQVESKPGLIPTSVGGGLSGETTSELQKREQRTDDAAISAEGFAAKGNINLFIIIFSNFPCDKNESIIKQRYQRAGMVQVTMAATSLLYFQQNVFLFI
jgi:hypothetical protein